MITMEYGITPFWRPDNQVPINFYPHTVPDFVRVSTICYVFPPLTLRDPDIPRGDTCQIRKSVVWEDPADGSWIGEPGWAITDGRTGSWLTHALVVNKDNNETLGSESAVYFPDWAVEYRDPLSEALQSREARSFLNHQANTFMSLVASMIYSAGECLCVNPTETYVSSVSDSIVQVRAKGRLVPEEMTPDVWGFLAASPLGIESYTLGQFRADLLKAYASTEGLEPEARAVRTLEILEEKYAPYLGKTL